MIATTKDVATKAKRRSEVWPVTRLKPNPQQSQIFTELSETELRHLADDIQKNGLLLPIEALPDGTIIGGHQRLRAIKLLGRNKVRVWVRDDLTEREAAERFPEDNLNRRHMTLLEKARAFRALKELDQSDDDDSYTAGADRRDILAKKLNLNVSGKTLERLKKCLELPVELQTAAADRSLSLMKALQVGKLFKARQKLIAARVVAGEPVNDVVNEALGEAADAEQLRRLERPRMRYDIEKDVLKGLRAMREYGSLERITVDAALAQALQEARAIFLKLLRCKPV